MSYTPPSYSSVNFNFTKSYTPPSYNAVNLEFVQNILDLDSANIALTTNPLVFTRTYKLDLVSASIAATLSSVIIIHNYKLNVDSSSYSLSLLDIGYDSVIRNLSSSYSLSLSSIGLSVAKAPLSLDSCSFTLTASSIDLLNNKAIGNIVSYSSSLSDIVLTYTPVAKTLQLNTESYSSSLASLVFSRTHAPLVLLSNDTSVSGGAVGYLYSRSLNLSSRSFLSSTPLEEKVYRKLNLDQSTYGIPENINIDLLFNTKINIVDFPSIISLNDLSFLYSKVLSVSTSSLVSNSEDVILRKANKLSLSAGNIALDINNLGYSYYRLNLDKANNPATLHNINNYYNRVLNLQSSHSSLSIRDVVVRVLEPFNVDEVFVLVGDTNSLLSTVTKEPVISIANTKIIDTSSSPKLIETLEDKLLSTTHKVTLINITSKD